MSDKTIQINLYLLRNDKPQVNELTKCVVAASTESEAKELANHEFGTDGYLWNQCTIALIGHADDAIDGAILSTRERDCEFAREEFDESVSCSLYLLERNDIPQPDEWSRCVVAAASESKAREIANRDSKAEGYVWNDGRLVNSTKLGLSAKGLYGSLCFARERDS